MSHTPGDWKVGDNDPFVYALNDAGTNRFCASVQPGWIAEGVNLPSDPRTSHDELMANARLIAAAPDLLAELKQLVRLLEPAESTGLNVPGLATLNAARAAIAKAEGK